MTAAGEAPGRVNLIGEHTDHQGGLVLPTATPQRVRVSLEPRRDRRVRVESEGFGAFEYALGSERRGRDWEGRVLGLTALAGPARGFDARVTSDLPSGAGLGSSAALAIALLRTLRAAGLIAGDDLALALLAHRAERELVARVGRMDQLASSFADESTAILIDTRSLAMERVAIPHEAEVLVVDSGQRHDHTSGAYDARADECVAAARALGVAELRDVDDPGAVEELPEPLRRRARHVVSENVRVRDAVALLRRGDWRSVGPLLDASHRSLRDDFEVSTAALDVLASLARSREGVVGARLMGGGFGGSIVALAGRGSAREAGRQTVEAYERATGLQASVLVPGPLPRAEAPAPGK